MDPSIYISNMNHTIFIKNINKPLKDTKYIEKPLKDVNNKENVRTKIVNYSPISINEVNICHIIEQIPYYSNFFSIIDEYKPLHISELDYTTIPNLTASYYLFTYYDKHSTTFTDHFYNEPTIPKLISDTIDSFQHLLDGLILLHQHNICVFDMSPSNILFLEEYREKPVIRGYHYSLDLRRLNMDYISSILNEIDDFTYKPFEIHVLYYFTTHKINTISYSFIEEFCDEFIDNMSKSVLRLFSESYKQSYKQHCVQMLKSYINCPTNQIINDLLERSEKWDVYSISMIYIHLFGCISRVFSLKGTFISSITIQLMKNLHPDSDQRMTLEETLDMFHYSLNEKRDWSFIHCLDHHKLTTLFDEFSK